MNACLSRACLAYLLIFSQVYGAQVPQGNPDLAGRLEEALTHPMGAARLCYAPRCEAEACRRAFDLQAKCEVGYKEWFHLAGAFVGGACKNFVKHYPSFVKNSSVACLLAVAGALVGNYVYDKVQENKTKRILAEQTVETFPEDFMQNMQERLARGEQVDPRTIEEEGDMVLVSESEIQQWAAWVNKKHCFVCHKDTETGQLILILPFYSPEAREVYRGREEMLGQRLNIPISYKPIQEMNPLYKKTSDFRALISLPFAHDIRQPRLLELVSLGDSIKSGRIVADGLQEEPAPI